MFGNNLCYFWFCRLSPTRKNLRSLLRRVAAVHQVETADDEGGTRSDKKKLTYSPNLIGGIGRVERSYC
ncbi:hypothetical protein [Nostoc sp.]|uniref:hypothetical protein n=1 Tax=Nostoc sp. TaxID=1180 RepID=UPI002FFCA3E5